MLRHYTYDGLGRLIKSTYASGFANRVEHHHYDGVRRIQTVVASNVMSTGGALTSGDPGLQSMAIASEPSGESTDPGNTNLAFTSSQLGATGQTFTVHREYVWGPGDSGVDELLVYYDSGDDAWWCLTDLTGDLVAVCDLGGTNGSARVCAQWTYDAYGSVMSADHIHPFEKPGVGHKGLFLDRLDLANPQVPQLVPFAQSIYHNRNRVYVPQLGRFLQRDPNATAAATMASTPHHGLSLDTDPSPFSLDALYGDGANLYQYLDSVPWMNTDPTGLFIDHLDVLMWGVGGLRGGLEEMLGQYADNMLADIEWAMDWDMGDDWHTRSDDSWVNRSFAIGAYHGLMEQIESSFMVNEVPFYAGKARLGGKIARAGGRTIRSMRELSSATIYESYSVAKKARRSSGGTGHSHHLVELQMTGTWRKNLKGDGPAINIPDARFHLSDVRIAFNQAYKQFGGPRGISISQARKIIRQVYRDAPRIRNAALKYIDNR